MLLFVGVLLQNIPGTYTFREASAEVDADSPEGVALLGMDALSLSATLEFDRSTLQRVSRNAQLRVPAGATLRLSAESRPRLDAENGEVVLEPENVLLVSDKPLTFIYRNVPLARSRELATGPDGRLRVRGRYRVLSALPRLHRYRRERGPRRDWQAPDRARLDATGRFTPEHTYAFPGEFTLRSGAEGGKLRLEGLRYENGVWRKGRVETSLQFGGEMDASGIRLHEMREGSLILEGGFVEASAGVSTLDVNGRLAWEAAKLSARDDTLSASLPRSGARAQARLTLDRDHRVELQSLSAELTGRVENFLLDSERDQVSFPSLDLTDTPLRLEIDDPSHPIRIEAPRPLDLRGLSWTRARPGETLRIEDGRLRLDPMSVVLSGDDPPRASQLSGLLEAWTVSLTRRETQRVTLTDGVRLRLRAERVRLQDGEFLIEEGRVEGRTATLTAERNGLGATLRETVLAVHGDREDESVFTFQGRVQAHGGADVRVEGPRGLPDLSVFASSQALSFAGDQDHIRLELPKLTLSIPRDDLKAMLEEALDQNRDRIREETRDAIGVEVNVRDIRSLAFGEDSVEVVGAGRVSALGGIFDTRFSARMRVDFDLPGDVMLDESKLGARVYLTGLSLNRVNPRIERLILNQVKQPLLRETRPLKRLVGDLPGGVRVAEARLYPEADSLALEISGEAVLR